jgi:hypothetical protein
LRLRVNFSRYGLLLAAASAVANSWPFEVIGGGIQIVPVGYVGRPLGLDKMRHRISFLMEYDLNSTEPLFLG